VSALALGIVVPCRNEAAVIERKLSNLALCRFPESDRPHRIVVVDDGSDDATRALALAACARLFGRSEQARASVVRNTIRPGKPGAIRAGIAALEGAVDVVVLTDADVVFAPGALDALVESFARDPDLAMACGAQTFVAGLASDGSCRGPGGGDVESAMTAFDTWTARVRRFESRLGRLFSVHGQLLAWRASLALEPAFGIAADDLELMLQVRARDGRCRRVERVQGAEFFEVKTPPGDRQREQALRRARAYVQVLHAAQPGRAGWIDRAQWLFYRYVPTNAPLMTVLLAVFVLGYAAASGWLALAIALVVLAAIAATPIGRRWLTLMSIIRAAVRLEARESLPERWEMKRT
jgi:glycosyltransferase involved in cell wall biosynthesis